MLETKRNERSRMNECPKPYGENMEKMSSGDSGPAEADNVPVKLPSTKACTHCNKASDVFNLALQ